jgi:hypothetical protein
MDDLDGRSSCHFASALLHHASFVAVQNVFSPSKMHILLYQQAEMYLVLQNILMLQ